MTIPYSIRMCQKEIDKRGRLREKDITGVDTLDQGCLKEMYNQILRNRRWTNVVDYQLLISINNNGMGTNEKAYVLCHLNE